MVGEEWEVRVLAFVSDWGGCWSVLRMGEPFCRVGSVKVSLEVDRLGFWVNEKRRELRGGKRGGDWWRGFWSRKRDVIAGWIRGRKERESRADG